MSKEHRGDISNQENKNSSKIKHVNLEMSIRIF